MVVCVNCIDCGFIYDGPLKELLYCGIKVCFGSCSPLILCAPTNSVIINWAMAKHMLL